MNIKASKHFLKSTVLMFKTEKKVPIVKLTPDNKLLSGKVALIVGGGGGIGAAITEEFIKSGCKVIVTSRTKAKCEEIWATLSLDRLFICQGGEELLT